MCNMGCDRICRRTQMVESVKLDVKMFILCRPNINNKFIT